MGLGQRPVCEAGVGEETRENDWLYGWGRGLAVRLELEKKLGKMTGCGAGTEACL